jgi:hypothetical protein
LSIESARLGLGSQSLLHLNPQKTIVFPKIRYWEIEIIFFDDVKIMARWKLKNWCYYVENVFLGVAYFGNVESDQADFALAFVALDD